MNREVVVTGIGAVTPLGVGARTLHERWCAGRTGISDGEGVAHRVRALRPPLGEGDPPRRPVHPVRDRGGRRGAAARPAGTDELPYAPERVGVVIGTGIGGIGTLEYGKEQLIEFGPKKVPPLSVPLMMSNAAPAALAMRYKLHGPSHGVVSACSAGADGIGTAVRLIQAGDADAMVTGGSEAALTALSRAAFAALDALSDTGVSRPFDLRRDGFVMGEGAGVLIIEDGEKARARGAKPLARIRGYGASSDAFHITAPDKTGAGPANAILRALEDAGLTPEDIVYINAHGTSTPLNDRAETIAIKRALGDRAKQIPVSSHQVGDRPPAGRRRRGGGGRHDPRPARPDRAPHARLRGARGGPRPRLRAGPGAPASTSTARPPSASRTRSGSAATTPSCAWRPHEHRAPPRHARIGCHRSSASRRSATPDRCVLLRSDVRSARMGEKSRAGDGVIAGHGRVDGRPVFCYAQDPSYRRRLARRAARRLDRQGPAAGRPRRGAGRGLHRVRPARACRRASRRWPGYARIFREHVELSGKVPQISVICGASAGGGSYSPALTDFVVMTERGDDVPHRSRRRARGHGRGRHRRRAGRHRASTSATASRTS